MNDNSDGHINCDAETAALSHGDDVNDGLLTVEVKGGYIEYSSIRMSDTWDSVHLQRTCPINQKKFQRYIKSETPVILRSL